MIKRIFDIFFAAFWLVVLIPIFLLISLLIILDSSGGIFYRQMRVGRSNKEFKIFKFRTMHPEADKKGLLTVGDKDSRITKVGCWLRKYKLDELPQLVNVLLGDMSVVGPRPEIRKYVDQYTDEQMKVFGVKPGITDYASLAYIKESELLKTYQDPEDAYIKEIMPQKLDVNLKYVRNNNIIDDFKIIILTFLRIFGGR